MLIKQITYYVQGRLSQQESDQLWIRLLKNPDELQLLEIYLALEAFYSERLAGKEKIKRNH